jgi:hypothetical protein
MMLSTSRRMLSVERLLRLVVVECEMSRRWVEAG